MANFNTYTTKEADFFHSEPDARRMQLAELKDRVQNREGVRKEDFDGPSNEKQNNAVGDFTPTGWNRLLSTEVKGRRIRGRRRNPTPAQIETADIAGVNHLGFWRSKQMRKKMFQAENRK